MSRSNRKPIWPRIPPSFVRGQLLAHKLLGLTLAAVMYLVCLTGAIAVFYADFERWEKPGAPEMSYAAPEAVGRAVAHTRAHINETGAQPLDVFVITPSQEMPRLVVDYEGDTLAFDANGAYAGSAAHELTHFLIEMHYALNLPWQIGFIVVGILGVLLTALIVGGALSLPRMFRDAFTLRLDGGRRLSRVDLHNRMAVWGLPFHLVVAVSGAVMGVGLLTLTIVGFVQFGGDGAKAMAAMYGDPAVYAEQARTAGPPPRQIPEARIVAALETLARERPDNPPLYMALNQFGTANEGVAIGAAHRDRLIYAETYRFDSAGGLMTSDGYSDGEAGRQFFASMFRIHAGAFGGVPVKFIYLLLGLALSLLCTTGIDIWLAKSAARGRAYPRVQAAWTTFVWAVPALLAITVSLSLHLDFTRVAFFWSALFGVSLAGIWASQRLVHWLGPLATGIAVLTIPAAHVAAFGGDALGPAAVAVNAGFVVTAAGLLALAVRNALKSSRAGAREPILAPNTAA